MAAREGKPRPWMVVRHGAKREHVTVCAENSIFGVYCFRNLAKVSIIQTGLTMAEAKAIGYSEERREAAPA